SNDSERSQVRARALEALKTLGADVRVDDSRPDKPVVEIDLSRRALTDDNVTHLAPFTALKVLRLNDTEISSAGLAHLSGLTRLEKLDLSRTKIGDGGLRQRGGWVGGARTADVTR